MRGRLSFKCQKFGNGIGDRRVLGGQLAIYLFTIYSIYLSTYEHYSPTCVLNSRVPGSGLRVECCQPCLDVSRKKKCFSDLKFYASSMQNNWY